MTTVDFQAGARATMRQGIEGELRQAFPAELELIFELDLHPGQLVPAPTESPVSVYRDPYEYQNGSKREHLEKIAVLCRGDMSDYIFALPALNALRLTYPHAEIILIGEEWQASFLEDRPSPVDRVEVVPELDETDECSVEDRNRKDEVDAFINHLAAEGFDLVIQMRDSDLMANALVQRLSARLTVGFRLGDAAKLDRSVPYSLYQLDVLRYLEVVSLVGVQPVSLEARIPVIARDLVEAERCLPDKSRPLAILHPFGEDVRRTWTDEKFAALGKALVWNGAQVVILGSEADYAAGEALKNDIGGNALNLCGCLSLNGLAGALSNASVVIGNNGSVLHLAMAVGASTVGIYWCADMMTSGPVTRSRHRPSVSWRTHCPVCGIDNTRSACNHQVSYVDDISVEEVLSSALDLLFAPAALPHKELLPAY